MEHRQWPSLAFVIAIAAFCAAAWLVPGAVSYFHQERAPSRPSSVVRRGLTRKEMHTYHTHTHTHTNAHRHRHTYTDTQTHIHIHTKKKLCDSKSAHSFKNGRHCDSWNKLFFYPGNVSTLLLPLYAPSPRPRSIHSFQKEHRCRSCQHLPIGPITPGRLVKTRLVVVPLIHSML